MFTAIEFWFWVAFGVGIAAITGALLYGLLGAGSRTRKTQWISAFIFSAGLISLEAAYFAYVTNSSIYVDSRTILFSCGIAAFITVPSFAALASAGESAKWLASAPLMVAALPVAILAAAAVLAVVVLANIIGVVMDQ